jgi:hypothetical protein
MTVSARSPLTRLTVNLIPRADSALTLAAEISGDSKTDTVNRALQVYAYLMHVLQDGDDILIRHPGTGETERLVLLGAGEPVPGRNELDQILPDDGEGAAPEETAVSGTG